MFLYLLVLRIYFRGRVENKYCNKYKEKFI